MNNVLCIGEALIDMICTDKGSPLSDGEHFLKKAGGAPMNVAAAIAAFGGNVTVAAKVGNDPFGKHLIDVLNAFHVDTRYVVRDDHHFTTFAFVSLMQDGERDFYFNRGADGMLTTSDIASIDVNAFQIVHFGSATAFLPGPLQSTYTHLLQQALQKNAFVSFDPNYRQLLFGKNQPEFIQQSWNFIERSHFFKVSDEEAYLITGTHSLQEATAVFFKRTKAVFAITLGKEGTLLGMNGHTAVIPSIPVQPVDTTGAGDAFVGALLFQLSQFNRNEISSLTIDKWSDICKNANKAGAKTCEYMGGMEAFKHLNREMLNR